MGSVWDPNQEARHRKNSSLDEIRNATQPDHDANTVIWVGNLWRGLIVSKKKR